MRIQHIKVATGCRLFPASFSPSGWHAPPPHPGHSSPDLPYIILPFWLPVLLVPGPLGCCTWIPSPPLFLVLPCLLTWPSSVWTLADVPVSGYGFPHVHNNLPPPSCSERSCSFLFISLPLSSGAESQDQTFPFLFIFLFIYGTFK